MQPRPTQVSLVRFVVATGALAWLCPEAGHRLLHPVLLFDVVGFRSGRCYELCGVTY